MSHKRKRSSEDGEDLSSLSSYVLDSLILVCSSLHYYVESKGQSSPN